MEFGVQFFPDVGPDQKSAQQYFYALDLVELAEQWVYAAAELHGLRCQDVCSIRRLSGRPAHGRNDNTPEELF